MNARKSSGRVSINDTSVLPSVEPETLGVHAIFLSRQHQPPALCLPVDFLVERICGELPPWGR